MHTGGEWVYMRQKLVQFRKWGSLYAYGQGTGVHAAEISTKFANGDPRMRNEIEMERLLTHHKLIPVCIRGLPVCVRGGRPEIFHMGSPRLHNKVVRIWGATYIIRHVVWGIPTRNVHHLTD